MDSIERERESWILKSHRIQGKQNQRSRHAVSLLKTLWKGAVGKVLIVQAWALGFGALEPWSLGALGLHLFAKAGHVCHVSEGWQPGQWNSMLQGQREALSQNVSGSNRRWHPTVTPSFYTHKINFWGKESARALQPDWLCQSGNQMCFTLLVVEHRIISFREDQSANLYPIYQCIHYISHVQICLCFLFSPRQNNMRSPDVLEMFPNTWRCSEGLRGSHLCCSVSSAHFI